MNAASIRVVGGGTPTSGELAAMTVALEMLAAEASARAPRQALPGWRLAALREGVGEPVNVMPPPPELARS